jgi:Uri superfamily endonuclease
MIRLTAAKKVIFGRYNHADAVFLPTGIYLYAGSARGERRSSSLGARLMRHATRCDPARPHAIRDLLLTSLLNAGIPAKVPASKRCRWHIDYLLELPQAEICGIIAIRTRGDLEAQLARGLAALPETAIPARGLGASNDPGSTHLFYLQNEAGWQKKVSALVKGLLNPDDGMPKI